MVGVNDLGSELVGTYEYWVRSQQNSNVFPFFKIEIFGGGGVTYSVEKEGKGSAFV